MRTMSISWSLAGLLGVTSAHAAGFALIEQNASGLGNAYAGQAAAAQDASTVFFNPAGLSWLEGRQAVVAGHLIVPSSKLRIDPASTLAAYGNGGDAGETAFVPNFFYAMDINPALKFGLGLSAPFGLATEYDVPWAGQTQAIRSDLKTYNLNPSLGWKINDHFSVGLGIDWQRIEAELSQAAAGTPNPPIARMKGDDNSWGWNAGVIWSPDGATRVGLAYRSQIKHELRGNLAPADIPVVADLTLPETFSLSFFRPMNAKWDFLADITWTGWSSFDQLTVRHAANDATLAYTDESWDNARRYSVGVNYHMNKKFSWRAGLAYDETPIPDAEHRTPRIPDADRTWITVGGQYRMSQKAIIDFGYAHLFINDSRIDHTANGTHTLGTFSNRVDILSAQYTHKF